MFSVSGERDVQGVGVDRSGRYHLDQYLVGLRKQPLLDNESMVSRGRAIYACQRKISEEIARFPCVVRHLIGIHNEYQSRDNKVGNYVLSVGDQSVEAMDLVYEANRSRNPKEATLHSVEQSPEDLVASLDELSAHFSDFQSKRRSPANRAKAFQRCQALFLRLELRWPVYRELLDVYTSATDSLVDAAVDVLCYSDSSRDENEWKALIVAIPASELSSDDSSDEFAIRGTTTVDVLATICPALSDTANSAGCRRRLSILAALEAELGSSLGAVLASMSRFKHVDSERVSIVGDVVQHNLLLVAQRVRQLSITDPDEIFDAIQDGNQGLMEAAERYKYWLGNKFSTVAVSWIKHYHGKCRKSQLQCFDIPVSVENLNFKIARARKKLQDEGIQDPTHTQLARHLKVSLERVQNAQAVFFPADRDEDNLNAIADERHSGSVDAVAERDERDNVVRAAVDALQEPHREVCALRFGLGDGEVRTLEEISDCLGLSKERIRSIEKESLCKMLRGPHAARLKSFASSPAFHAP